MRKALLCVILIIVTAGSVKPQRANIDSLINLQASVSDEKEKMRILNDLIYALIIRGKYEEAKKYVKDLKDLGIKNNSTKFEARSASYEGLIYFNKGNAERAIAESRRALSLFDSIGDSAGIADVSSNIGMYFSQQGVYHKALEHISKALDYYVNLKNKAKIVIMMNNMGDVQYEMGNYRQAEKYFSDALSLAVKINHKSIEPFLYTNMGNCQRISGNYRKAIEYYNKALEISLSTGNSKIHASSHFNLGTVYYKLKEYRKSLVYLEEALRLRKESGDSVGIITVYNMIGRVNIEAGSLDAAGEALSSAMNLNKSPNNKIERRNSYLHYSSLDSARGKYSSAFEWYKKYSSLNEELIMEAKGKEIGRLEARYEFEKREEQLLAEKRQREIEYNSILIRRNTHLYIFGAVILFMAAILLLIIKGKRDKQKINELLVKKVEERTRELRDAKEKAESSERIKDEFLSQMSHEIRTPLSSVISLTSVLQNQFTEMSGQEVLGIVKGINKSGQRIIRTVEMLLNYSEAVNGTFKPRFDELDLNRLYEDIISDIKPAAVEKKLSLNYFCYLAGAKIYGDEYSVKQIMRQILENAVTYTEEGKVEIILTGGAEEVVFECRDTGIGMSEEYLQKLFTPFVQEESGYTRRYDGNGLGLALAHKYCEINGALISCSSEKGKGTLFTVRFKRKL